MRTERQAHGFVFQGWVLRNFLDVAYTAKWDIPSAINSLTGESVSIKTAKWKGSVGLGNALHQFDINEDFELLIAFYDQIGTRKKIVNMNLINVPIDKWRQMWGEITRQDISRLDKLIKDDTKRNVQEQELNIFRKSIQLIKDEILNIHNGDISLNPKIDSKGQRRLQCSISFKTFFEQFNLKEEKINVYKLWGKEVELSKVRLE